MGIGQILRITALLVLVNFLSASAIAATAPAQLLIGKWRAIKLVQTVDGVVVRNQTFSGGAVIEYRADGTWSLDAPGNRNGGRYRFIDIHSIESTITTSDRPHQLGFRSIKQVRITEKNLELVTQYDENGMQAFAAEADGARPKSMLVTSTFERVGQP